MYLLKKDVDPAGKRLASRKRLHEQRRGAGDKKENNHRELQ